MPIDVTCPGCQQAYRLSDQLAGKKAKCKSCGGVILIPSAGPDELVNFDEPPPLKAAPKKPSAPPPLPAKPVVPPKPPAKPAAASPPLPKIAVTCDMCFTDFQAKGELAGKKTKCPDCGEPVSVPAPKAKKKAKVQDDDDDFADDVEFVDDVEEDFDPPPKRGAKGKQKTKGGKRSSKTVYFVDTIPMPVLIGGMWTLIIAGCVILVMFGKGSRNGAAMAAGGGGWNAPAAAPPIAAAQSGPATQPYDMVVVPVPPMPEPGPLMPSPTGGFQFTEATFNVAQLPGGSMRVRLRLPNGNHVPGSLGCIFVAEAGTLMIWGVGLTDVTYYEESQLYINAGYAVCEYSMDGAVDEEADNQDAEIKRGYQQFAAAYAGVVNVRNAVEFVLTKMPMINPHRLYIAGHSSAGSTALLAAAHEPRFQGAIAYCAPADLLQEQREMLSEMNFNGFVPDIREFLQRSSPITHVLHLDCPVFLFHGDQDVMVSVEQSKLMHARLIQAGKQSTLKIVTSDDHYASMTQQGLPLAIEWLRTLPSEQNAGVLGAVPAAGAPAGAGFVPGVPMPVAPPAGAVGLPQN